MRIAIGADHAGFVLKDQIRAAFEFRGYQMVDFGAHSEESTDYPDYASAVCGAVVRGEAERGILVCSTGVGMSIAANKIPGIRAALAFNEDEVELTRGHNDANVIALGARYTTLVQAERFIDIFLRTPFDGGRHQRRIDKIAVLEQQASKGDEST